MSKQLLAGVDIGGTKTAVVLSRHLPEILTRVEFPTRPEDGPEPALAEIARSLDQALSACGSSRSDLLAIGISCGGPLDTARGLIQSPPNLPTWAEVPICDFLQSKFATRCFLENDANAGALAEASFGAGRGLRHVVFLTMGTGIGAGLILNGELQRGATNSAGEIGHVRLTRTGPRAYGKRGAVEAWASGNGMAQVARMYLDAAHRRGQSTSLKNGSAPLTAREVGIAAQAGDPVARAIVRKVGEQLGAALAVLIDVVNPECIAIGGLALRLGEELLAPARRVVRREALRGSAEACRIVAAELGEKVGDVAALCAAVRGLAYD